MALRTFLSPLANLIPGQHPSGVQRLSPEDSKLLKHIEDRHPIHNHNRKDVDVAQLFHIVQEILTNATQIDNSQANNGPALQEKRVEAFVKSPDLPHLIEKVSCEMTCKCLDEKESIVHDVHGVSLSVLTILSDFSWEATLVITLAALSMTTGELGLVAQFYKTSPLAKSMGLLKQLPFDFDHSQAFKQKFEAVFDLIRDMLQITKQIVQINNLVITNRLGDDNRVKQALVPIPVAVYWTINTAIFVADLLGSFGYDDMTPATTRKLTKLNAKLDEHTHILEKIIKNDIEHIIKEIDITTVYVKIMDAVEAQTHKDNMSVLQVLLNVKGDAYPLQIHDQHTKKPKEVGIDVLRGKTVLFFITGLQIDMKVLSNLKKIYNESKTHPYEIVWVPVIDWSLDTKVYDQQISLFQKLQFEMPWYTISRPSMIHGAAIKFFKTNWNFKGEPVLVALDNKGNVQNHNAFHMLWIWGSKAFPFTTNREHEIWKQESWNLELLLGGIDAQVQAWIKEKKYIMVFGGDDIESIRNFVKQARAAAQAPGISIELLYVGKSCKNKGAEKIIEKIKAEKLCHTLDVSAMWLFWTRLQTMFQSKVKLNKVHDTSDSITQEIMRLMNHDKHAGGNWSLLTKDSSILVQGQGSSMIEAIQEYPKWTDKKGPGSFIDAIISYFPTLQAREPHCCRFEFPAESGEIPRVMKCPECKSPMQVQKYITFACCPDGDTTSNGGWIEVEGYNGSHSTLEHLIAQEPLLLR